MPKTTRLALQQFLNILRPHYLGGDQLSLADCAYPTTLFMLEDVVNALDKRITLPQRGYLGGKKRSIVKQSYLFAVCAQVDDNRDVTISQGPEQIAV